MNNNIDVKPLSDDELAGVAGGAFSDTDTCMKGVYKSSFPYYSCKDCAMGSIGKNSNGKEGYLTCGYFQMRARVTGDFWLEGAREFTFPRQ